MRETGLAILWAALPVVAMAVFGAAAVRSALHRAEAEETGELEAQAELHLHVLLGHAGAFEGGGGGG